MTTKQVIAAAEKELLFESGFGIRETGVGSRESGSGNQELGIQSCESGVRIFKRHTHQTHIMLGGRCYPIGHPKQLTMYLLNNILGGGSMSSRLYLSLREKHGLVYNVDSQATPLSDTGYWNIYMACIAQRSGLRVHIIY